ncbi:MAG: hypothetical protein OER97_07175 [Gammaproteobacteria bacterium]|nr:hypothetical protein [Gammaproteobacteria bacterium]
MDTKITKLVSAALLLTIAPMAANAAKVKCTPNFVFEGRTYEIVEDRHISWDDANAAANALEIPDVPGSSAFIQGSLATIITALEDEHIRKMAECLGIRKELWVGGFQEDPSPEPGEGWQWIIGEPITPTPTEIPYTNWKLGEPDNNDGAKHLAIGQKGDYSPSGHGWIDQSTLQKIGGYVVEYGDQTFIDPIECEIGNEGCVLLSALSGNPGVTQFYPSAAAIAEGATLAVLSKRVNGDDARCGISPLELVGLNGETITVPPYLCGSPDFIYLQTITQGVEIPDDTVFVENQTDVLLPNNLYSCEDPIVQNFPTQGDPQFQDVVAWQSTERTEMLEDDMDGVGGMGIFEGSVAEVTNACGSSKGRTRSNSFYFVGLHIDFGDANDWAVNMAGNFDSFVALTRYKLVLLRQAVENAKPAVKNGDYTKMKEMVENATSLLDAGNYNAASTEVNNFVTFVDAANYNTTLGFNHRGEHLWRGDNLQFMFDVKLIPYIP